MVYLITRLRPHNDHNEKNVVVSIARTYAFWFFAMRKIFDLIDKSIWNLSISSVFEVYKCECVFVYPNKWKSTRVSAFIFSSLLTGTQTVVIAKECETLGFFFSLLFLLRCSVRFEFLDK